VIQGSSRIGSASFEHDGGVGDGVAGDAAARTAAVCQNGG
jgi:hypothetical protein